MILRGGRGDHSIGVYAGGRSERRRYEGKGKSKGLGNFKFQI